MSLLDLLRQEYLTGKVVDKYKGGNGNLGLVIEDSKGRYHVEFKDNNRGPCIENLFVADKFSSKIFILRDDLLQPEFVCNLR